MRLITITAAAVGMGPEWTEMHLIRRPFDDGHSTVTQSLLSKPAAPDSGDTVSEADSYFGCAPDIGADLILI